MNIESVVVAAVKALHGTTINFWQTIAEYAYHFAHLELFDLKLAPPCQISLLYLH